MHEELMYLHIVSEYSKKCAVPLYLILKVTSEEGLYQSLGKAVFAAPTVPYVAWRKLGPCEILPCLYFILLFQSLHPT